MVESQSPWEAGSGCREAAHISRQSPILCQKGDTFQTRPAIYHQEPVFLPAPRLTPLRWKAAQAKPPFDRDRLTDCQGFTVSVCNCTMSRCHLNYLCSGPLCPDNDAFCWQCGQKKSITLCDGMQGDAGFVWVSHKQKERGRGAVGSHCVSSVLVY